MLIKAKEIIPPRRAGFYALLECSKRNKGEGRTGRYSAFHMVYSLLLASIRAANAHLYLGGGDYMTGITITLILNASLLGCRPHPFIQIGDPFGCLLEALLLEGDETQFPCLLFYLKGWCSL